MQILILILLIVIICVISVDVEAHLGGKIVGTIYPIEGIYSDGEIICKVEYESINEGQILIRHYINDATCIQWSMSGESIFLNSSSNDSWLDDEYIITCFDCEKIKINLNDRLKRSNRLYKNGKMMIRIRNKVLTWYDYQEDTGFKRELNFVNMESATSKEHWDETLDNSEYKPDGEDQNPVMEVFGLYSNGNVLVFVEPLGIDKARIRARKNISNSKCLEWSMVTEYSDFYLPYCEEYEYVFYCNDCDKKEIDLTNRTIKLLYNNGKSVVRVIGSHLSWHELNGSGDLKGEFEYLHIDNISSLWDSNLY